METDSRLFKRTCNRNGALSPKVLPKDGGEIPQEQEGFDDNKTGTIKLTFLDFEK